MQLNKASKLFTSIVKIGETLDIPIDHLIKSVTKHGTKIRTGITCKKILIKGLLNSTYL